MKLTQAMLNGLNSDDRAELLVSLHELAKAEKARELKNNPPKIDAHPAVIAGAIIEDIESDIRKALNSLFHKQCSGRSYGDYFRSKGPVCRTIRHHNGSESEHLTSEQKAQRIIERLRQKLNSY